MDQGRKRATPSESTAGGGAVVAAALDAVPLDGHGALYEQLARALRWAILEGRLRAGCRLPGTRQLANTLGVSRNTVLNAYEILCAEQLTVAEEGMGTRVAQTASASDAEQPRDPARATSRYGARLRMLGPSIMRRLQPKPRYDLHYGEPLPNPRLFQSWRRKLSAAAAHAGPGYPNPAGFPPLRRALCEYLARRRGIACTEEQILIVGGTQQAMTLAARVILNEGDRAAVEDPHYQHVFHALTAHGAQVIPIATGSEGMVTSEVVEAAPRLIYVTPSHQFPSGYVLPLERRLELLQIAARQDAWIFEDDYDSEFQYSGRPPAPLRALDLADRVIYVGSFSKTLFPSLRLGYMVCPNDLRTDLERAKQLDDLGSPVIEQAALATFILSRQFERYLRAAVRDLADRRRALLGGLRRYAGSQVRFHDARAGAHVAVWLPHLTYVQFEDLCARAAGRGLGLYPIHPYYRHRPEHPGLLLGFAGLTAPALEAATKLLGQCLDELR